MFSISLKALKCACIFVGYGQGLGDLNVTKAHLNEECNIRVAFCDKCKFKRLNMASMMRYGQKKERIYMF